MASQRPPAWFRLSSMANRLPTATPVDPAPAPVGPRPPPAPIPALIRPSFSIRPSSPQTQEMVPTQTPPPAPGPFATRPPLALVRPSFPIRPPSTPTQTQDQIPTPTPTPPPPAVALLRPAGLSLPQPVVTPPRSPVSPPAQTVALPRNPNAWTVAPPLSPPAPPRSPPVLPPASPPRSRAATPSPTAKSPPVNSTSPVENYKNFPASSSVRASPRTKTGNPASSMPNSPISKHVSTESSNETVNEKSNNSSERTPARSPTTKPLSRPPSPLTLPPAQLKTDGDSETIVEQKNILLQETTGKPMRMHNPHSTATAASNEKREPIKHNRGTNKKIPEHHESGTMVITLAGENRGAVMELSPFQRKKFPSGNPHTLNNANTKVGSGSSSDQSSSESVEEGLHRNKDKNRRGMTMQPPPTSAYLNSNVQGMNNSILYNFTYTQNDPGVHLSLNRKANGSRHKD